jgi:UDP-GlcNAc:undecaprenyl-phosphate/decaprenyl-phosphate GlcNAc-1-phosphate transferase
MMQLDSTSLIGIALALVAALALTPLVRALARRYGMVTRPRADRWAKKPTALLGGVAIFAAFALAAFGVLPQVPYGGVVLGASAFIFLLGLVDDLRPLKPYQKLVGQIVGASIVILGGLTLPWTPWPVANMALTILWLVGITNAVNLLDNMDGLAAGVGTIAAAVLAAIFLMNGEVAEAALMAAFAATLIGFLVYNFNPASIFMGDCGSLFIGFFLASAALLNVSGGRITGIVPVLAVPALLLLIPIFDTTLVTILRKLAGRSVSQGGRDHASHRLVALGLSERKAVALLYLLAAASGMTALLVRQVSAEVGLAVMAVLTLLLTLLAIHLSGVKVYPQAASDAVVNRSMVAFLIDLSHKRRVFEVLLDVGLIGLSYYAANLLVFGPLEPAGVLPLFVQTLPVLGTLTISSSMRKPWLRVR